MFGVMVLLDHLIGVECLIYNITRIGAMKFLTYVLGYGLSMVWPSHMTITFIRSKIKSFCNRVLDSARREDN